MWTQKKERGILILWQLEFYVIGKYISLGGKKICQLSVDKIIAKGENCM